ncbi:hypothetical protein DXG01_001886 [Tephrocybe rancida]|nr:hypothetical protein DXG01_001886 [Tephrocybe rancida]
MAGTTTSNTTHVLNDTIIDPTKDRNPSHWLVERDPPPDVHIVYFQNPTIGYSSYDPPKGFTAEELVKFRGAKEARFTFEEAKAVIKLRNEHGTLVVGGEDRYSGLFRV